MYDIFGYKMILIKLINQNEIINLDYERRMGIYVDGFRVAL